MRRLLIAALLCSATSLAAAQTVSPAVFKALNDSQVAQQKGDYVAARRALESVQATPGSVEEALLWRSRAYVAWAEGRNAQAIEFLDKALSSGKLDAEVAEVERLNLAKLNLSEERYTPVVKLLAGMPAQTEEVQLMLVQAYQGLKQYDKALPLAERYVQANPKAGDRWLQFLVAANADLKRYAAAETWQRRLLLRHPDQANAWRQLAGLQQLAGKDDNALATLRTAYAKGVRFDAGELDNLVLLASAAGQPWQGARMLAGMLDSGLLPRDAKHQERLAQLWWQARDRQQAVRLYRDLADHSSKPEHWLYVAQLELEQERWQAGLDALRQAERAGADRRRVREWRDWAQGQLDWERQQGSLARAD